MKKSRHDCQRPFRHRFHTTTAHLAIYWSHRSEPFSHAVFLFLSSQVKQSKNHQSGLFPPSVKITKVGCGDSRMNKVTFLVRKKKMMFIHPSIHPSPFIPYPDISDLLTRGNYLSVNVQAGLPLSVIYA